MDILLWLGPLKSIGHGIESIPGGFQDMSSEYTFPPSIKYSEVNEFTCRVHLYQGHFLPCDEVTGTCSLYITIYFDCKSASSTIKELLSPVWMETLVIGNSKIFGNIEDVKKNPPSIVIEVHNKGSSENMLFSRQLVKPHVFLARDKLQPPMYPPKPDWLIIQSNGIDRGEILAMFEIVQDRGGLAEAGDKADVTSIPDYIKLSTVMYKFEILFWGLRRTKSFRLSDLSLPSVTITLGSLEIHSYPLRNLLTFPNFNQPLGIFEVNLPEDWHYAPPVVIRLYDSRAFGTTVFIGSHIVRNLRKFVMKLPPRIEQKESKTSLRRLSDETFVFNEARFATQAKSQYFGEIGVFEPEFRKPLIEMKEDVKSKTPLMNKVENRRSRWWNWLCWCFRKKKEDPGYISIGLVSPLNDPDIDEEFFDWWTKYYDSLSHNHLESEMPANKEKHHKLDFDLALFGKKIHGLHFYPSELENCPDFDGFEDTIRSFLLTKQSTKAHSDTGKFKGCIGLYKTNTEKLMTIEGNPAEEGVFSGVARELGAVIPLTVRVYVIRAHQLYSREKFGTVNPFIEVAIPSSSQIISDSKHFIPQEKNPIFGKCYELDARLPFDSTVVVRVMDKMRLKEKELIGETAIDLENRYYSRHRGTCGLQREYASEGYNAWRDVHKPSEILTWLCLSYNLPLPEYNRGIVDQVVVGGHRFTCVRRSDKHIKESLALTALLNWQDVPIIGCKLLEEHVETRSLFLPHQQGIEKGKLEMWVDIFPGMMELPPPVDVKPRTPQKYELRAVVWSTRNVKLVDDGALVGKQNTDIFVKGWLKGKEDVQKTDVHYASLTGEGIFNWRFVFNFSFDRHEQMIVSDDFSNKIPPILYLQAWDQERISSNEYIGSLSLDLRDLPPPSKRLPLTKVYMPIKKWKRNLFKDRYARGWWPFIGQDRGRLKTVGMVDLELFLLTDLEAERSPAGRGRNEPDALPEPLRPIVKYTVWIVPFRAIKNYLWRYHKGAIFKLLIGIIMGIFIMVLVYAIPNYSVKKAMNA